MAKYFLGVDGGQSSTIALIGDETGRVVAQGRGGPCNHVAAQEARQRFLGAIGGAVAEARRSAGLPDNLVFEGACLGFSGGPADKDALIDELFVIKFKLVTNDALIALAGAHAGQPGVITIAGTGSIAYGRNQEGKIVRTGGWGYVYGDEGGGFDLTRQALRAALRQEEGWGPETALHRMLMEATGARNANDLMHRFYTPEFPRPRIAGLSRIVVDAAAAGDIVADGILENAAQQLAGITNAALRQLFKPGEPAAVAPMGGVFKAGRILERFREIVEAGEKIRITSPQHGPAAGALYEAYRVAGRQATVREAPDEKS